MNDHAADAQGSCRFTHGFAALHDQIPAIVGDCIENEHFEPSSGNALQRTTGGLLVWRKADNWTAFTDGAMTWIQGPNGVGMRSNGGPLFPWESPATGQATASQPAPPASPPPTPTIVPRPAAPPAQPLGEPWVGDLMFSYDENGAGAVPPGGKLALVGGGTVYGLFSYRNAPPGSRIAYRVNRDRETVRTNELVLEGPNGRVIIGIVRYAVQENTGRQANFIISTWELVISLNGKEMTRGSITPG